MNARAKLAVSVGALTAVGVAGAVALAQGGNDFKGKLTGYQEVPALSTSGHGTFRASVRNGGSEIRYRLTYARLEAKPLQAHIHLGQRAVNAGVIVFLCETPAAVRPARNPVRTRPRRSRERCVRPTDRSRGSGHRPRRVRRAGPRHSRRATCANVHTEKYQVARSGRSSSEEKRR